MYLHEIHSNEDIDVTCELCTHLLQIHIISNITTRSIANIIFCSIRFYTQYIQFVGVSCKMNYTEKAKKTLN